MSMFKQAVKAESKLRMAITGPSGSGKTYTALAIATALAAGKPVAVVDTEHGSASKYADLFAFDVAEMHPPFHPDKFINALAEAAAAGYAVVVLDSISHAWSGSGGVLDVVDEAAKRSKSGNTYAAWKEGTPIQNRMIDAIVQSGVHVIATMRSKTEYVLVADERGRQAPRKVGMAPVQRDQFEYEFDVVLDMDIENNAIVSKTRCPALTGHVFAKPGADVAGILANWLQGAEQPQARTQQPAAQQATRAAAPPRVAPPVQPSDGVDDDVDMGMGGGNPFEDTEPAKRGTITPVTLKRLHALGHEVYGKQWDAKRAELVLTVTTGATDSAADLLEAEAKRLCAGMDAKKSMLSQPDAKRQEVTA